MCLELSKCLSVLLDPDTVNIHSISLLFLYKTCEKPVSRLPPKLFVIAVVKKTCMLTEHFMQPFGKAPALLLACILSSLSMSSPQNVWKISWLKVPQKETAFHSNCMNKLKDALPQRKAGFQVDSDLHHK